MYMLLYFPWFSLLERSVTTHFHVIHMAVDDLIPFCEYFIIPYLAWFPYVAGTVLYFMFTNRVDYLRLCIFLFTGMTVFLLISTIYPNGAYLRPVIFTDNNIFIRMVRSLYRIDTPTNLFPSIHVYNSIGVWLAVWKSPQFTNNFRIRIGATVMSSLIIMSTVFLKQHSVFDVITAFVMAAFMYMFTYAKSEVREPAIITKKCYQNT
ncbi:MAG: serine/threonine protein phosphatase [Lachnospiraceae bacterium]